jgi:hypothetical protein
MSKVFGGSPPAPPSLPPLPTMADEAVKDAERKKLEEELRRRRGLQSTILTSGLGDPAAALIERLGLRTKLGS